MTWILVIFTSTTSGLTLHVTLPMSIKKECEAEAKSIPKLNKSLTRYVATCMYGSYK